MRFIIISCACFLSMLLIFVSCHVKAEQDSFFAASSQNPQASPNNSQIFDFNSSSSAFDYHSKPGETAEQNPVSKPTDGGIKEIIPPRLQLRYQRWKDELLSTQFGRSQWEQYAANKNFVLTITISDEEEQGAGTGKYQWDETGELVGATITLGNRMDKGYPNPAYFPVMNSLLLNAPLYKVNGNILAAAKIAHEFGHVNSTGKTDGALFQRQNKLMPVYNKILLENGYNTSDPRLIEMVNEMGGAPVAIWENREYWGESNAMLYLLDRINKENFYCLVVNKIKHNVEIYAKDYEARFNQIAESAAAPDFCHKY